MDAVDAIVVRGLEKSYGSVKAVQGIDLRIQEGEVFALLGPNGAGKTTTVEILEGFRRRDGGEVSVLGMDPAHASRELKARIGIVLQSTGIEPYLTVRESIQMFAASYPSPRPVDEVIELVGLVEKRDERVTRLSGGQQRRLDVAIALAGDPELLFLDEPTTGFDPGARRNAWQLVRDLRALGKTILLTTHYMDEAQELADQVAVIAAGRIVAEGSPDTLGGRAQAASLIRLRLGPGAPVLPEQFGAVGAEGGDGVMAAELRTTDPVRTLHDLTGWALQHAVTITGLEVLRPSLEDLYLEVTGEEHAP